VRIEGAHERVIAAPPERCFAVLTDYAAFPEWWPGCRSARVVSGAPATGAHEVDLVFDSHTPVGLIDCRLRFDVDPPSRIRPSRVAGRLRELGGEGWTLRATNGGTLARYQLAAALDTGLPGFVERPFRDKARHFLIEAPVDALGPRAERG
jgi:uncharacterized protein YndB with AHSA1/START domain